MDDTNDRATLILTLGDGDFTYSLDLARYLTVITDGRSRFRLVATGIDTKEELLLKYKDTPHILGQLDHAKSLPQLVVSVKHSVNAILPAEIKNDNLRAAEIGKADHVIFNHPHLGTEDAALHGRFLCHFFHSCVNGWLNPNGGLVYLTLVNGQYERWDCEQAAKRQGLKLLQRTSFTPPPVENPAYNYRRHQTGKSFESRRPSGSETFVFGREQDSNVDPSTCILSWPRMASNRVPVAPEVAGVPQPKQLSTGLSCPYCDRVFKEERSRKCHLRDKHPNGPEKKTKTENIAKFFECSLCITETGDGRSFDSEQALQDHVQAKHSAIHKNILPDWCQGVQVQDKSQLEEKKRNDVPEPVHSTCRICDAKFKSKDRELTHRDDFKPCTSGDEFGCQFCSKSFREARAKLQHENLCNQRPSKTS